MKKDKQRVKDKSILRKMLDGCNQSSKESEEFSAEIPGRKG
jgi:hypothetical protein